MPYPRLNVTTLSGALLILASSAQAQIQTPSAGVLLQQQSPAAALPPAVPALAASPATAVPLAADASAVVLRSFEFTGNQRLTTAALQAAVAPWLGRIVGLVDLRLAATEVERLYHSRGWLVQASLPAQDITSGVVQIAITEARMGQLRMQTEAADPVAERLQNQVARLFNQALPQGEVLNTDELERATAIADALPGVHASTLLLPGVSPGSTDVRVNLAPAQHLEGEARLDNYGNRATGIERANVQFSLNSPWGWGEQFTLAASKSRGSDYLRLGASAPLGDRGLRLAVNASNLGYQVLDAENTTPGLPPQGYGHTLGLDLQYPLWASPLTHLDLGLGVEAKHLANDDDNQTPGQLSAVSTAHTRGINIALRGSHIDRLGGGGASSASLAYSHAHLRLDGSPDSYLQDDASHASTQGSFSKLRWSASRLQALPADWSLLLVATGQFASKNLDASEKMYLGGSSGVRAYPTSEAGGSTGQLLSLELRHGLGFLGPQWGGWQASAFYDRGQVQQYADNQRADNGAALLPHNTVTLAGRGLALEWQGGHGLGASATWATRNGSNPLATSTGRDTDGSLSKNRFWLSASISF